MTRFVMFPDKEIDRPTLIMYSPNQEENAFMDDLTKGAWRDEEMPGHKYLKRERQANGKFRYWYAETNEREEKHSGGKYEDTAYRPPLYRVSDDVALPRLMEMGNRLHNLQAMGQGKDDTGFSNYDMHTWDAISSGAKADNPVTMSSIRRLLAKYKRQLTEGTKEGLDAYYYLGLADAVKAKQAGTVGLTGRWRSDGGFTFALLGRLGGDWQKWMAVKREAGIKTFKGNDGNWVDLLPADVAETFDFDAFRERVATLGVTLEDIPPRPVIEKKTPPPVPTTVDGVWSGLKDRSLRNAVGVKYVPEKNAFAFRFTPGKISTMMSNSKGDLGSITKWDVTTEPWTVWVFDIYAADKALERIKELESNFTVVLEGVHEARQAEEARQAVLRTPIPEVQAMAAPGINLFPYQNEGVRFLLDNDGNAMLGDEMGLGKTPQALSYGAVAKRRMIIVNPKNTRRNWVRESQKFFPGYYKPVELDSANLLKIKRQLEKEKAAKGEKWDPMASLGGDEDREIAKRLGLMDGNLASINYESVGKFMPYLKAAGFDTMVVDESHRMKEPTTQVSRTLTKLAEHVQHHILLSGTAIMNKREEFFSQFNIVKPGMFKSKEELTANKIGELWDKMRPFYLARQKRYVLKDLPEKLTTIVTNDMPEVPTIPRDTNGYLHNVWAFAYADTLEEGEKQGHAAEDYEDYAREKADEAVGNAQEELAEMDPDQKREMFRTSIGAFTKLGFAAAIAKAPHTANFVKDILQDSDQNVVIFTESKVAAKRIAKELGSVAVLHHGDMSQDAREEATARFDKGRRSPDEKARVLVTTRPSAAQGINLMAANVVVFNDLPWTGAAVAQAEDRTHRVGQDRGVNVYWMTATDNELDQNKSAIVHRKYILHRKADEGRPLTPDERKWMEEKVTLADLLRPRDEVGPDTGTQTVTKEIKAGKPVTTEVVAPTGPRATEVHTEATPPPQPAKVEPPPARPKSEYLIQFEQEEAARKAKENAEEVRRQDHYRASLAITSPFAAQHIPTVDAKVRPYFEKLHDLEATQGSKGAHIEIPRKEGVALARWFDAQRRAKNPKVSQRQVGTNHHFYRSPAGDLHLWESWHGPESHWNLDYTTLGTGTLDALPPERQKVLDELIAKYKEPEHNERPKFVIPAAKAIEAAKPAGGTNATAHEHVGENVHPPEDRLESKVEDSGQPQQLALFKALKDETFVLSASDFDLCMSLADKLVDAGEFEQAIDLIKSAGHKYIRRYPSGKVRPRWYYVYNVTSKHNTAEVQEGEKVRIHSEGQAGHYEVEKVHANGYVTVKHDESGQRMSLKKEHLHEMFAEEHQPAIQAAQQRLQRTVEAAKVHGTEKQQTMAKEALREHEERFQIKTPQRIATQKAQGLSVLARTAPSVENHQAAAEAHEYAAGFDTEHATMHKELARLHREAAKLRSNVKKSVDALKAPGITFHTPGKTETEKAAAPILMLPPAKAVGAKGPPKPKGAFFGDKRQAYNALVTDEFSGDFTAANKRYWDWKDGRGPKPQPYTGGELDAINQALGLEANRKGFKVEDARVSSLAEGWDRLVGQSKRWDSDKVMQAINILRQVPGLERMPIPEEAQTAQNARTEAESDAASRADQGGDYEEARLDDAVEKFSDEDLAFDPEKLESELKGGENGDTSFDFGFNVKPEHEDPAEAYKTLGPKARTFKAWFGDWESNPAEASKVVKADGSPSEQHNMAPVPVYHGTAVGGFTAFDPEKSKGYNIFGDGFYFTEDKGIATEYTEKDAEDRNKYLHGLVDAETGKPVTHLPRKWAQDIIDNTQHFQPPGKTGYQYSNGNWDYHIAAALKKAMEPEGVNVTKFLQEYRNPSGPLPNYIGEPDPNPRPGSAQGMGAFLSRLPKGRGGKSKYQTAVNPPQVFEVYLNIRKPIDMDTAISREDFQDLAGYMKKRESMKFDPEVAKLPPEERANARAIKDWKPDERIPAYLKNLNDNPIVRKMGDDEYSKAFSYEDMLQAKKALRAEKKETGDPAYGIFHLSDKNTLTWGDVHYIMTDSHWYHTPMGDFRQWAEHRGYDGIAHTGGWNIGKKNHRVWIAWKPNQIKATQNEGTFDPTTPDMRKSMKYQPNTFVILTENLEKAERGGQVLDHKYIKREGSPGAYRYTYEEPKGPAPTSLGPITSEDVPKHIDSLAQAPREDLEALDRRLDGYVKRLGNAAPRGLFLWQSAVKGALSKKGPAMVATVPELPTIPTLASAPASVPKAPEPPKMVAKIPAKPKQMGFDFSAKAGMAITPNPVAQAKDEAEMSTPAQGPDSEPVAVEAPKSEPKPETKLKAKTATAPKTKAKPETKLTPEGKLVATGDHIWGSRYDLAQIGKLTSSEQLNNMSFQDAAYLVTKTNLVPVHSLEVLRAKGQTPDAAHMTLGILASIRAKPEDTDKSRRDYVTACHEVVESLLNCKTFDDINEFLVTINSQSRSTTQKVATAPYELGDDYAAIRKWMLSKVEELHKDNPGAKYVSRGYSGREILEEIPSKWAALGPAFERICRHRGEVGTKLRHECFKIEKMGEEAGWEYLKIRGQADAEEKARKKAQAAEKAKGRKAGAEESSSNAWRQRDVPEEVERTGGKKVRDADPDRIKRTFNLREVDYGQEGWMTQKDREYHTARLEEALTDFAEILGVEPEVVSFKGRLGIALGARGHGKAAAHYETGRHVINITKFNGGGSVAHEWGHALDNIMGTVHLGNVEGKGSGIYLSEKREHSKLPEDVKAAIQDVWKAITKHPNPEEARRKHREELNQALEAANKLVRENNEKVATVRTLKEKPTVENLPKAKALLDNRLKQYAETYRNLTKNPKPNAEMRRQIENLDYWMKRTAKQREYLDAPDAARSPEEDSRIATLEADIEDLRYDINKARTLHNTLRRIDPEASEFYRGARKMGEYWHRTVELFARGFESHIEDQLTAKGRRSTYLVSGTQSRGDGAYPQGAERENIGRAMGKLIDVLHKGGHLEKALRTLSLPLQRFTIQADMTM